VRTAGVEQREDQRRPHQYGMVAQASGREEQAHEADDRESRHPAEILARPATPAVQRVSKEAGVEVHARDEGAHAEKRQTKNERNEVGHNVRPLSGRGGAGATLDHRSSMSPPRSASENPCKPSAPRGHLGGLHDVNREAPQTAEIGCRDHERGGHRAPGQQAAKLSGDESNESRIVGTPAATRRVFIAWPSIASFTRSRLPAGEPVHLSRADGESDDDLYVAACELARMCRVGLE
jgi:hypothetical protein